MFLRISVWPQSPAALARRKRHSFYPRSTEWIVRVLLSGGSLRLLLFLRQASDHPEIVTQDRPGHRELTMLNSFAEQGASQNIVLKDRDPSLGLRTPVLDLFELPGPFASFHLCGRTRGAQSRDVGKFLRFC